MGLHDFQSNTIPFVQYSHSPCKTECIWFFQWRWNSCIPTRKNIKWKILHILIIFSCKWNARYGVNCQSKIFFLFTVRYRVLRNTSIKILQLGSNIFLSIFHSFLTPGENPLKPGNCSVRLIFPSQGLACSPSLRIHTKPWLITVVCLFVCLLLLLFFFGGGGLGRSYPERHDWRHI